MSTALSAFLLGSAVATADPSAILGAKDFLADAGLGCCADVIMRKGGWFESGAGVDSVSDLRYLSDEMIGRLPIPQVKRNLLASLASRQRENVKRARQQETRREGWTHHWLENTLAATECLMRGFMLGAGVSFIYETLLLNRDFYVEQEKLLPRVQRAAYRAATLGVAVAVTMHGSAIVVPHSWRSSWLAGGYA